MNEAGKLRRLCHDIKYLRQR